MSEIPHPVRTLQHIGWVVLGKLESVWLAAADRVVGGIAAIHERITDDWTQPGERDN